MLSQTGRSRTARPRTPERAQTRTNEMHPRLLTTSFFSVYTFGVLLASAYLAAFWWLIREGRREGLDIDALSSLGFWAIGGAVIGAKALMIVRDLPEYLAAPAEIFSRSVLMSAGDFYGGFIGALIASAIFFRRHPNLSFWRTADLCGPAIALGQAIGRIGCFMAGDDYGRPTQLPWAVTFTDPDVARIGGAPLGVPLHPVQLYESIVCLVLFAVLVRLSRHKRFDGVVILAYTLLYAIARFMLEFFRGDADRGFVFGGLLSTSQFIAVILGPAAVVLWCVRRQSSMRRSAPEASVGGPLRQRKHS
jgi:phosphatidylglycerol:prolipoprotein diacylglycerol transferase